MSSDAAETRYDPMFRDKPQFAGIVIQYPDGRALLYGIKDPEVRVEVRRDFSRSTFKELEAETVYTITVRGHDIDREEVPVALTREEFEA